MLHQAFEPCGCRSGFNARCFGLQQEGGAGKLPFHALQQGVAVGVAPAADFGSGQEGEDVRGVAVEAFGKLQHGVEVGGEDGHVPAGDDAVLEVVAGDVLVGGEVGRAGDVVRFEYAEHGHYLHDAADVDGKAGYAARHFAAVGKVGADEEVGEEVIEQLLLFGGEAQGEEAAGGDAFQLLAPLHAQAGEYGFEVGILPVELVLPLVDGGHVVEELAREQAVFGGGDERFHLGGSAREQDGEVAALHFAVFAVGAAVVGEAVVVEGLAHGVAPVAVFRADGGGDGVGFALAYQADAFGVHDVLQDARAGVVARDEEHAVGRQCGRGGLRALLAQRVVGALLLAVLLHGFCRVQAYLVVDRLHQQADEGEHALARGRQGHDECLQAGRYHLAAVGAAHVAVHAGAQHGDGAQQHDVLLGAGGAVGGNFVQRCGPERPVVEAG